MLFMCFRPKTSSFQKNKFCAHKQRKKERMNISVEKKNIKISEKQNNENKVG